jgi:hypothetical protein
MRLMDTFSKFHLSSKKHVNQIYFPVLSSHAPSRQSEIVDVGPPKPTIPGPFRTTSLSRTLNGGAPATSPIRDLEIR